MEVLKLLFPLTALVPVQCIAARLRFAPHWEVAEFASPAFVCRLRPHCSRGRTHARHHPRAADELAHIRRVLEGTQWVDGRTTAGDQAAKVKNNLQVPAESPVAKELGQIVL